MQSDETLVPRSGNQPGNDGSHGSGATPAATGGLERPGDQVGPYRLVRPLGEGGFGEVWLAERRHPFVQQVALKIVKPGMDSKAVVARFEQERQALALMNHPHIAKVLDGGMTPHGRPYFVMEYVKGESISAFCDRHRLEVKDRLRLFLQVCEAIQHAHTKGIIHRDLKPANVIVTMPDEGHPVAKVIDFGIAKAVTGRMTDHTVFTETGQMVGTPEYVSPEQADPGELDIDTRTDVYSLGIILYELLAGALPFDPKDLRSRAYREMQRIIREDEPPTPSARLSTIATRNEQEGSLIAAARRQTAKQLQRTLKSELEWIPLKAIRKDRKERYATTEALAADVSRYLNGEVLEAGPTTMGYRIGKWLARRELPIALSLIALGWLLSPLLLMPLLVVTGKAQLASGTGARFASGAIAAVIATLVPTGVFLLAGRIFLGRSTSAIRRLAYIGTVLLPGQLLSVACLTAIWTAGEAGPKDSGMAIIITTIAPLVVSLPFLFLLSPLVAGRMRMPVLSSTALAWLAVIVGACAPVASLGYVYGTAMSQTSALVESRQGASRLAMSDLLTAEAALNLAMFADDSDDQEMLYLDTERPRLAIAATLINADKVEIDPNTIEIQRAVIRDLAKFLDDHPDVAWRRLLLKRLEELQGTLREYEFWQLGDGALSATFATANWKRGNHEKALEYQRRAVKELRESQGKQPADRKERAAQALAAAEADLAFYEQAVAEDRAKQAPKDR